jgi:hypothetical protein
MVNEKRRYVRITAGEPAEIVFFLRGALYFGSIVNLSPAGLCVEIHETARSTDQIPAEGGEFDCCITGVHGSTTCRGNVCWVVADGPVLRAGLSLLNVSDDDDDPWRLVLNRHYRMRLSGAPLPAAAVRIEKLKVNAERFVRTGPSPATHSYC